METYTSPQIVKHYVAIHASQFDKATTLVVFTPNHTYNKLHSHSVAALVSLHYQVHTAGKLTNTN